MLPLRIPTLLSVCVCVCVCAHVHADVWAWGGEEPLNWGCPGELDSCGFHESDICPNALGVISQLPPDSYVEILTPNVMVLLLYGLIRSWVWALTCTFKEKLAFRTQPTRGPSPGPSWDLRLQPAELWEMKEFLLKSHPVHGVVLSQAEQTNTACA